MTVRCSSAVRRPTWRRQQLLHAVWLAVQRLPSCRVILCGFPPLLLKNDVWRRAALLATNLLDMRTTVNIWTQGSDSTSFLAMKNMNRTSQLREQVTLLQSTQAVFCAKQQTVYCSWDS